MSSTITTETSTLSTTEPMVTAQMPSAVPTHGRFRYISKGIIPTESPHFYHLPELTEFGDVRSLPIQDIKSSLSLGSQSPYKLSDQGFTARISPTVLSSPPHTRSSWHSENALKSIYIPEVERLLLEVTGGKTIFTDQVVMRTATHTEVDGLALDTAKNHNAAAAISNSPNDTDGAKETPPDFPKLVGVSAGAGGSPAPKVHLDFAPSGARTHLRKYHTQTAKLASRIIEAEDALLGSGVKPEDLKDAYDGPRWAMFSVWRPLKTVRRDPLALSDCRTFPKEDYIPLGVLYPSSGAADKSDNDGSADGDVKKHREEVFLAYGSDKHDWHWIANQTVDEVLIIQLFDSEAEKEGRGVAGGVMHSSIEIDGTENEEARESVEVRCTVMW